jgi:hypothetical protein
MSLSHIVSLISIFAIAVISPPVHAGDIGQDLEDLMLLLPGEYDGERHLREDIVAGVLKADRHGWVNRSFTKVDAPDVGDNVIVQTVVYNGRDGFFDRSEFIVWTISGDEARNGVSMQPRWFKDVDAYISLARTASALAGLKSNDLKPAGGAAGCEVFWTRRDRGFVGSTNAEDCVTTSDEGARYWQWQYELTATALKADFKGLTSDGTVFSQRSDGIPWRLDRLF